MEEAVKSLEIEVRFRTQSREIEVRVEQVTTVLSRRDGGVVWNGVALCAYRYRCENGSG